MDLLARLIDTLRRASAERKSLRLIVERGDDRLLRDAGLTLLAPRMPEPLPIADDRPGRDGKVLPFRPTAPAPGSHQGSCRTTAMIVPIAACRS